MGTPCILTFFFFLLLFKLQKCINIPNNKICYYVLGGLGCTKYIIPAVLIIVENDSPVELF